MSLVKNSTAVIFEKNPITETYDNVPVFFEPLTPNSISVGFRCDSEGLPVLSVAPFLAGGWGWLESHFEGLANGT